MKSVPKLDENDIHDLWSYHFRNKAFSVRSDLSNLHKLFQMLAKDKTVLFDKYINIGTQFRLCKRELDNLITAIDKVDKDFTTEESIAEFRKRCPDLCEKMYGKENND